MRRGRKNHKPPVRIRATHLFQPLCGIASSVLRVKKHIPKFFYWEFLKHAVCCSLKIISHQSSSSSQHHQILLGYFQIFCKKILLYVVGQNHTTQLTLKINEYNKNVMANLYPFMLLYQVPHFPGGHDFKAEVHHQPLLAIH